MKDQTNKNLIKLLINNNLKFSNAILYKEIKISNLIC